MSLTVLPTEVRDRLAGAKLTYRETGATAGNLPAGYHQFSRSLPIGYGHQLFAAAGDAVRQWQVQLGAGLQVSASSPTAVAGTVPLLGLGIGSLRLRRHAGSCMPRTSLGAVASHTARWPGTRKAARKPS
jgi:uncharacterized protein (UPF0548 family)